MPHEEEFALKIIDTLKNNALRIFNITNFNKYLESCAALEKMDIPKSERAKQANTHYALYLIKMYLLINDSHQGKILIENGELVVGNNRVTDYDIDFLERLCAAESISFIRTNDSTEIEVSVQPGLEQSTNENSKKFQNKKGI